jgi:hypothetical protein
MGPPTPAPQVRITTAVTLMSDRRYDMVVVTHDHRRPGSHDVTSRYTGLSLPQLLRVLDTTMASEFSDPI